MKIKFSFAILMAASLFMACNQQTNKKAEEKTEKASQEVIDITPDEFIANAAKYVDKKVNIKGGVKHICKHGGKRLFLYNADSTNTLRIEAGENIPQFDATCEGGNVLVSGIVKELRIDEDYLMKQEADLEGEKKEAKEHGHKHGEAEEGHDHGAHSHALAANVEEAHADQMKHIQKLREQIKTSEKGYISRFWIEGTKYEILAEAKTEKKEEETK